MKIQKLFKSMISRSGGNRSQTAAPISLEQSGFTKISGASAKTFFSSSTKVNTPFGSAHSDSGHSPRVEAEEAFFISMMFVMLATNVSFFSVWLAFELSPAAIVAAFIGSFFWHRAWRNFRRADEQFDAANYY